jgi:thiol-disulfide isomerase/thioredoxin
MQRSVKVPEFHLTNSEDFAMVDPRMKRLWWADSPAAYCYLSGLLLSGCCLSIGCGPSEPTEISAATSGYKPAEGTGANDSSSAKAPVSPTNPPNTTTAPPSATNGLATAPEVPSFEPGKLDPKIANNEYMKLSLSNVNDSKSLVDFLERSTRCLRELIADTRKGLVTNDLLLERGMELSRMKMSAAEALGKIAATDDEKAAAALGKLEALSQMANFRDVIASDQLRELAAAESSNADPRVSQQAKSIVLNLLTMDVDSSTAKPAELMQQLDSLLAGKSLTMSNLSAIAQALAALDKKAEREPELKDAIVKLAKKTEESFRDHNESQLALAAWEIYAVRTDEFREFGNLFSPRSETLKDPEKANAIIQALMTAIPSPWTSFVLLRQAIEVEYKGYPLVAKEMIRLAETQADKLKNEEERQELLETCKQFQRRLGIIDNVLDLSSLVDLEGKPIDMKRYEGKVVLVDFWASWCGPCIQEIPNIEKVFELKNKDGFEVIGINLDEEQANIEAFFKSRKLPWVTYVSKSNDPEEKGFNSPIAKAVGISAIPFIAVIGKDGKVSAIHVRGPKMETKVAELLAKE